MFINIKTAITVIFKRLLFRNHLVKNSEWARPFLYRTVWYSEKIKKYRKKHYFFKYTKQAGYDYFTIKPYIKLRPLERNYIFVKQMFKIFICGDESINLILI